MKTAQWLPVGWPQKGLKRRGLDASKRQKDWNGERCKPQEEPVQAQASPAGARHQNDPRPAEHAICVPLADGRAFVIGSESKLS
jgi:hypothetical protein